MSASRSVLAFHVRTDGNPPGEQRGPLDDTITTTPIGRGRILPCELFPGEPERDLVGVTLHTTNAFLMNLRLMDFFSRIMNYASAPDHAIEILNNSEFEFLTIST